MQWPIATVIIYFTGAELRGKGSSLLHTPVAKEAQLRLEALLPKWVIHTTGNLVLTV